VKNPAVWKKINEINKEIPDSNKSSPRAKKIAPKEFFFFDCGSCHFQCKEKINHSERKKIGLFYSNSSWETQTVMILSSTKIISSKEA